MARHNAFKFNFIQLLYFLSAARYQNFSKAAQECHVVPNVISKQIANLENSLGITLFKRNAKSVELTEEGRVFMRFAQDMLLRFNTMVERFKACEKSLTFRLNIGYYNTWESPWLPEVIRLFRQDYQRAQISLDYYDISRVTSAIENRQIDIVFTMLPFFADQQDEKIRYMVLEECPVRLAVSTKHPLAEKDSVTLAEIRDGYMHELVVPPPGGPFRKSRQTDMFAERVSRVSTLGLEQTTNSDNIIINIEAGNYIAFLPESRDRMDYREDIRVIDVTEPRETCPICAIWNADNQNPALPAFLEVVQSFFEGRDAGES